MEPRAAEEDLSSCGVNHEESAQQSNIHISDVIAAIQNTDPTFEAAVQQCGTEMYSGGSTLPGPSHPPQRTQPSSRRNAYVKIIEQPASKSLRFRYECEGRSAGSIPGVHSTPENKTYPTIEIVGYKGRAVVVVSCVTKDKPYKAHPHNLVGKDGCKKGVCTVEINSENMIASFSNLGIQCVKKRDIEEALRLREEIKVDPFRNGFPHRSQHTNIDLNAVRLCFQVFLEGNEKGRFTYSIPPIVSDIIYDKKAMSDLLICKMSHCSAPVAGGKEIILLCEKVAKEDISIRFYEEVNGEVVWEGKGDFQHANVHKQVAISFRSPKYKTLEVDHPVKVWIQLRRPSDGAVSEPLQFEMLPLDSDPVVLKHKRQKFDPNGYLLRNLQPPIQDIASMDPLAQPHVYNIYEMSQGQAIKAEPRDQTPPPYGGQNLGHYSGMYPPMQNSPSPQPHATPSPAADYGAPWSKIPSIQSLLPTANQTPDPNALSNIFNMDNNTFSSFPELNPSLDSYFDGTVQSNTYQASNGLDIRMNIEQENMTDSFTRLTTKALDDLTRGSEMN